MNKQEDKLILKIENFFKVPKRVADKIKNTAEKTRGGYVLFENRAPLGGSKLLWTKLPVAKMIFHKSTQSWNLYWRRASGKWWFYGKYKTSSRVLNVIEQDKHGCFWG